LQLFNHGTAIFTAAPGNKPRPCHCRDLAS
jgi:hypothetical protein